MMSGLTETAESDSSTDRSLDRADRLARLTGRRGDLFYRLCFRLSLAFFLVFTLAPLYYLLALAVTPNTYVGPFVPPSISPQGFVVAWEFVDWGSAFLNSMILTLGTLVLVLAVAIPAAYAFGRFEFPGRKPLLVGIIVLIFFPKQGLAVALFGMFTTDVELLGISFRLFNTYAGIILPLSVNNLPLSVALLTVFFASVPDDLEKAARVEGATRVQAFRHAVLPLAKPGIVSVAILVYVDAYTENFFTWFMTFGPNEVGATVNNHLYSLYNPAGSLIFPNALAAAALIGLVPSALVLLYMVGKLDTFLSEWGAIAGH